MSVSSHLTPEPERRLWIMHENMRSSVDRLDLKTGWLAVFAALQFALVRLAAPAGPASLAALALLAAVLPLGVFAVSPWIELPRLPAFLETPLDKVHSGDFLISPYDIAKYTHSELVLRLDKYLGGGITAMPYYEDIVGQVVITARLAARKRRVLRWAAALTALAQLCLLSALFLP